MILTTERLTLRRPETRDAPALTAFYETERAQYTGGHVPPFRAWLNTAGIFGHWTLRGYGLWALTRHGDDQLIGMVGPFYPEGWPETEIGWLMLDGFEGHGYAAEAARAVIQDTRDRLGWTDIVHYIAPENARSIALAERLGARRDPRAVVPKTGRPCLVYRQPQPGQSA